MDRADTPRARVEGGICVRAVHKSRYSHCGKRYLYCGCLWIGNVAKTTTTIKIDERGRTYIPKAVRERLGIPEEEVYAEITVEYSEGEDD